MMGCNQCGFCCKVIFFIRGKKEVVRDLKSENIDDEVRYSLEIVQMYWRRISVETALDRLHEVKAQHYDKIITARQFNKLFFRDGDKIFNKVYLYECLALKDNRCLLHNDKPRICAGYPNYWWTTKRYKNGNLHGNFCGYWDPEEKLTNEKKK